MPHADPVCGASDQHDMASHRTLARQPGGQGTVLEAEHHSTARRGGRARRTRLQRATWIWYRYDSIIALGSRSLSILGTHDMAWSLQAGSKVGQQAGQGRSWLPAFKSRASSEGVVPFLFWALSKMPNKCMRRAGEEGCRNLGSHSTAQESAGLT